MTTIAIANQKGGVGKTTIAFNLAKGLAQRGFRVLAIDNDPQGNLTGALLEDPTNLQADIFSIYQDENFVVIPEKIETNLELIGSTIHLAKISDSDFDVIFRLSEGIEDIKNNFDFVLIDCLPSFGYLTSAALNAADLVLIPTKPAPFALAGLKDLLDTIEKTKRRLNKNLRIAGIVLNLVEGRQTTIGEELESILRENYQELVFQVKINKGVKLEESPSFNQSVMEYDPNGKQAIQINQFLDEFLMRLDLRQRKDL